MDCAMTILCSCLKTAYASCAKADSIQANEETSIFSETFANPTEDIVTGSGIFYKGKK
jgi:hypothetical protein